MPGTARPKDGGGVEGQKAETKKHTVKRERAPPKKEKITMKSISGMAKKRLIALGTVLIIVIAAAVISFQTVDGVPNWKRIYQFFGVSDVSQEADSYDLSVHFIDVGKADGIYIRCNGKHILIDSGDVEYPGR